MFKDKNMFALILAIFLSVLFITGWVFADRNVMDLIKVTPFLEAENTEAPALVFLPDIRPASMNADFGTCQIGSNCN